MPLSATPAVRLGMHVCVFGCVCVCVCVCARARVRGYQECNAASERGVELSKEEIPYIII